MRLPLISNSRAAYVPRTVSTVTWPQLSTDVITFLLQYPVDPLAFGDVYFDLLDTMGVPSGLKLWNNTGIMELKDKFGYATIAGPAASGQQNVLIEMGTWAASMRTISYIVNGVGQGVTPMYVGYTWAANAGVCNVISGLGQAPVLPATKFKVLTGTYADFATADAYTGPNLIYDGLNP